VEATAEFDHGPESLFPYLSNLDRFMEWNPFPKMDPTTTSTLSDQTAEIGATLSWDGKRIGRGEMRLVELVPGVSATYAMRFGKPEKAEQAVSVLSVTPLGESGSRVSWHLSGERTILSALIVRLIGLDKMMTKNFKEGFDQLQAVLGK
jgi:uncharacterized protein YndB with AHSA1/START domain